MSSFKLIKLTSTYMLSEVLVMAGGFISFPIFTRILTKQEYGVMNLIAITLTLVEACATLGLRHAALRFYPDYRESGKVSQFYTTTISSSLVSGILGSISVIVISRILAFYKLVPVDFIYTCYIASGLVIIRVMSKFAGCIYRIKERAATYSVFVILDKYSGMFLSVMFISFWTLGIFGFFLGLVVGEALILVVYLIILFREIGFHDLSFSGEMLKEMVSYGFPMVIAGFAGVLLTMGDRYLIGYFMTTEDVAIYSVPYNLCVYITAIIVTAFECAFFPHIMNEWKKPLHGEVVKQIQNAILVYCVFAFPIIFGVIALGDKLILLLASNKYSTSNDILPYVIVGEILKGLLPPMIVGLQFSKKTAILTKYIWYAALLNIALNILLIPRIGLLGSAIATLASNVVLMFIATRASFRYFSFAIPWKPIFRYFYCALIMFGFLKILISYSIVMNITLLILSGVLIFAIALLLMDRNIKHILVCTMLGRDSNK